MMKGYMPKVVAALAVMSSLALAGCGSSSSNAGKTSASTHATSKAAKGGGTITIGDLTDLSGDDAVSGVGENHGAETAVDQINAAGGIKSLGGAKLALKTYDTESNPDMGATEAQAAVGDHVTAVIGGAISDTVIGGTNITQRAGVPWVVDGAGDNKITNRGYNTVFEVSPTTTQLVQNWINAIKLAGQQLGLSNPTVAVAYSQSSYGEEALQAFNALKKTAGLRVVQEFGYPLTTTDFSSIAARLAASHAEIVYDMGYPSDGIALAKLFATSVPVHAKLVLATGSDMANLIAELKSSANGVICVGDLTPGMKGATHAFKSFYQADLAKYHGPVNSVDELGYTAVQFIAAALEKAGSTNPAAVTKALAEVKLTHASGNIYPVPQTLSFTSTHSLSVAPFEVAQVDKGKGAIVYPSGAAEEKIVGY